MMKCLNCGEAHVRELSYVPCLFCKGSMNPYRERVTVTVTYADGSTRSGLSHRICVEAEKNWPALGLAPREVITT